MQIHCSMGFVAAPERSIRMGLVPLLEERQTDPVPLGGEVPGPQPQEQQSQDSLQEHLQAVWGERASRHLLHHGEVRCHNQGRTCSAVDCLCCILHR